MDLLKKIFIIIICLSLITIFIGCKTDKRQVSESTNSKIENIKENSSNNKLSSLENWIGNYKFEENTDSDVGGSNPGWLYLIEVYKNNDGIWANISIDGFQMMEELHAEVIGNEDEISFILNEEVPNNVNYHKGKVLLRFKNANSKILTYWGEINANVIKELATDKMYFLSVASSKTKLMLRKIFQNFAYKSGTVLDSSLNTGIERTTDVVSNLEISYNGTQEKYSYRYDALGNLTAIYLEGDHDPLFKYTYDYFGQMTRVDNRLSARTNIYTYDNAGNILTKKVYVYSTQANPTTNLLESNTYTYGDAEWQDKLTGVNGKTFTYDGAGNITSDGERTYTWQGGRQLASITDGTKTISYTYNSDGVRTAVYINGNLYTSFTLQGTKITSAKTGSETVRYHYDENDSPVAFTYSGKMYYYLKNLQGDIVGLIDTEGTKVAEYKYDPWGNVIRARDFTENPIALTNKLLYRGYYFDYETQLYYLNSRYYNPDWCRFINADDISYLDATGTVLGCNLFSYCENEPVDMMDSAGTLPFTGPRIFDFYKALHKVSKSNIYSVGNKVLSRYGLKLTQMMWNHAFYGKGKTLSTTEKNKLIDSLKKSKDLLKKTQIVLGKLLPRQDKNFDRFIVSFSNDLMLAIGTGTFKVNAYNLGVNKWCVCFELNEKFAFDDTRKILNNIKTRAYFKQNINSQVKDGVNLFGEFLESFGYITPFNYRLNFYIIITIKK